ncbi:LXG domain-containing protein [Bacillus sp. CECT 9360]|uniref:LXG domain-containing protein n=1 Tax=Bacillus sp. CECT 9360 TaxID=2845821 RepID=UPI001E32EB0C|nr:LXG domain-containing protein [Bacillus sp. CECT 9360]
MKVLDVNSLESGLTETRKILNSQKEQAEGIHKSISDLIGMNHLFAGKGADAILDFYNECHLPFLQFFKTFTDYYEEAVTKMDQELDELEPNNNGFILQSFLEQDLKQALNKVNNITNELTNEVNGHLNEVADIVAITRLNDDSFQKMIQDAQEKRKVTIEKLIDFDKKHSDGLNLLQTESNIIMDYIAAIESRFKSGNLNISTYKSGSLSENPSYNKLTETFEDANRNHALSNVIGPLSWVDDQLSTGDEILLASQTASVLMSGVFAKTHKVRYIGGKPTLMQKIRGDYRFSVRAADSWTSRGNYSNWLAKKFLELQRSNPSNSVLRGIQKVAASFRTPSDLIKFAAGYPKNMVGIQKGSSFRKYTVERFKAGVKEAIEKTANAKGLARTAKRVPVAGNIITVASNLGEFTDSNNRSMEKGEKFGRFFAGTVTDLAAVGAGAKVGATIGSIGGPVGIVVGGAVGGLAGAAISSKYGGKIKEAGGKLGKIVSKGISDPKGTLKSIGSWLK